MARTILYIISRISRASAKNGDCDDGLLESSFAKDRSPIRMEATVDSCEVIIVKMRERPDLASKECRYQFVMLTDYREVGGSGRR